MNTESKAYKYFAFISYSRKDSKVAAWLQKRLEWFRFPVKLVPEDRRPPNPKYVRPVYRDKTNLEVTDEHYWTNIRRALEESRFLIVLCSPNSARSEPVNMEVKHFLEVHGGDTSRVVPIIVGGNVVITGEDAALCPALHELGEELINRNLPTMVPDADIAEKDAWESGFVALSSYLLQLERGAIGDHIQRESRKQARTLRLWLGAVALLAALAIFAVWMAVHQLAETQRQLEFSWLEEGRAWLERARTAKVEKDHLKALMLAGRAVGFVGYGREENDTPEIEKTYPPLLGRAFKDAEAEKQRQGEVTAVQELVDSVSPTCLPIWSSPVQAHHRDIVTSVAFSPDGARLASGSADNTVKLWDAASGKEIATFQWHDGVVTSVAFSPDGKRLASGAVDKTVRMWGAEMGSQWPPLQGHSASVTSVAFSPDGSRVASGSYDQTVKLWDAATGKELASLQGHSGGVASVAFSLDGSRLASGARDKTVKLWDVLTGKELATLRGHSGGVTSVAFSPDGRRVASGGNEDFSAGEVKLWDALTGGELASLQGHDRGVTCVAFSPDGSRLVSGSQDETIKLWDVGTGEELATLRGHSGTVTSVAFSPDGSRVASSSDDKTVRLWDALTGKEQFLPLQGHSGRVSSVAFSPDGKRVATVADDKTLKLWDVDRCELISSFQVSLEHVKSVVFSPDNFRIVSGSGDCTVRMWDIANFDERATLQKHSEEDTMLAFSPNGSCIVSGYCDRIVVVHADGSRSWKNTVQLWDAETGKEIASFQVDLAQPIFGVGFSEDGASIFAEGRDDGTVMLWDAATGSPAGNKRLPSWHSSHTSPDGNDKLMVDRHFVRIIPTHRSHLNLLAPERNSHLALKGRDILITQTNNSLSSSRFLRPIHWRPDMPAQLVAAEAENERFLLRLRLCSQGGQWQALLTVWGEARNSGMEQDNSVRHEFAVQAAIAVRHLAVQDKAQVPESLWKALLEACRAEDWNDIRFTLPLAQALPVVLDLPESSGVVRERLVTKVAAEASMSWLESLAASTAKICKKENISPDVRTALSALIRAFARPHPASLHLLRLARDTYEASDAEWLILVNQILASPEAKVDDFSGSAYAAAQVSAMSDVVKDILTRLESRFPDEENNCRIAGWCHINLADHATALKNFIAAKDALKPKEKPSANLLAGLSIAQWLNQKHAEAITTYKQLIETGHQFAPSQDWADPKTIEYQKWPQAEAKPLEEVRQATLAKFPELAPQ